MSTISAKGTNVSVLGGSLLQSCQTPRNLIAQLVSGDVRLNWVSRGIIEIWISINGGTYELLTTTAANVIIYTDSVSGGATLDYKVRVREGIIYSDFSNIAGIVWTPLLLSTKALFWGMSSEETGGHQPNKMDDGVTYLTVTGSPKVYYCPDTAPYINADTDEVWFRSDDSQRDTSTADLIGNDLQRTPVKYLDDIPSTIEEIIILAVGATLTAHERNFLFGYMHLPILWDNQWNDYGYEKSNRGLAQVLFTPDVVVYPVLLTTTVENAAKANVILTFDGNLNESSIPATTAFTIAGETVNNVAIAGPVVTVTVSVAFTAHDVITIDYAKPATNYIRNAVTGTGAPSFTGQVVTNNIYLAYDTFTDADNVHLHDHTPDVGVAWTAPDVTTKIVSNELQILGTGTYFFAVRDVGEAGVDLSVGVKMPNAGGYAGALMFNIQSTSPKYYWEVVLERDGGGSPYLTLAEYNNDVPTARGTVNITQHNDTYYILRILRKGNNIKVYWSDGAFPGILIEYNSANFNDKTLVGLLGYRGSGYVSPIWDNFKVTKS